MKSNKIKKKSGAIKSREGGDNPPMKPGEIVSRVTSLAKPICEASGMELVHLEYQRESGGRILRLYIDKPGGVMLDDCVQISRQLSDILDVSVDADFAYRLEVSSPGPDRPIGKREDFQRFKGHQARIRISRSLNGQKTFTGVIEGLTGDTVMIKDSSGIVHHIGYDQIIRARLISYNGEN